MTSNIEHTLLHLAAANGNEEEVRRLLQNGRTDVNCIVKGQTIVDLAFQNGNFDFVQILICEFNATPLLPNSTDSCGKTLLHYACERNSIELVRTLILQHKADILSLDENNCTPLDLAVANHNKEVVFCLVKEFNYDTYRKDTHNKTVLHYAYEWGHLNLVKIVMHHRFAANTLVDILCTSSEWMVYKDSVKVLLVVCSNKDHGNESNLNMDNTYACLCSDGELIQTLICDHNAAIRGTFNNKRYDWNSPNTADSHGKTLLHYACEWGNIRLIRILICQCKADIYALDKMSFTPFDWAVSNCNEEVILSFVKDFRYDFHRIDCNGKTLLYYACKWGSIKILEAMIHDQRANILNITKHTVISWPNFNYNDPHGKTLLHYACEWCHIDLIKTLICDHNVNVEVLISKSNDWIDCKKTDSHGKTLLHYACEWGKIDFIKILIFVFNADIENLNSAVWHNPNAVDSKGKTILHYACEWGNIKLIRILKTKYIADMNSLDREKYTPIVYALSKGKSEVVLLFLNEFNYDPKKLDYHGRNLLHYACRWCNADLVSTLIRDYHISTEVHEKRNNTPLHVAVYYGREEIVHSLIKKFKCDPNVAGFLRYTPLHFASLMGHDKIVQLLLKFTQHIIETDSNGNTPLHLASRADSLQCVKMLLEANAPLQMRNSEGDTAYDVAVGESKVYLYRKKHNKEIETKYKTILDKAEKEYSGSHYITRVLVLGNTGAGKSTLIESLQRESFLRSLRKVSGSSVPPHTAGIIPSVYISKLYGRTLFYDFAGDAEYYSSHAAIFESIASSRKGNNICIVVVDLKDNEISIQTLLFYWFSFIQYQKFINLSFLVVGSHLDSLELPARNRSRILDRFCAEVKHNGYNVEHFMLDCRNPRSNQIAQLRDQIFTWIRKSPKYNISNEASLLLGLLQGDDFKEVTACPVHKIISHIVDSGVCLRTDDKALHQVLLELHEVGVLLVLGDYTKEYYHTILNISKLTYEVHKLLFSKSAQSEYLRHANFNIGIIPETILKHILPPHITKDCLAHFQYCQQISHSDIGVFSSLAKANSTHESFLFFPALCRADRSEVSWEKSIDKSFRIGWLALCDNSYDYFPPRFLHVLLLRLVDRFALHPARSAHSPHGYHSISDQSTATSDSVTIPYQQQETTNNSLDPRNRQNLHITLDLHTSNDTNQCASLGALSASPITPNIPTSHLASFSALHIAGEPNLSPVQCFASGEYSRRCTMWKKGVHWKMEEGVDCMVELVNESKGVVVFIKSSEDAREDCISIFTKVVSCVLEAKAEFCHSIKPDFFLLDSIDEADYLNKDHQFAVSDVERALNAPKGKRVIISVSGIKGEIALSKLQYLSRFTHWNSIFSINFSSVLDVLQGIVRQLYELGENLGAPRGFLDSTEADFPNSVSKRRRELVRWWMSSSQYPPPCWWHLEKALRRIHENVLAEKLREEHDHDIQLQEKLLSEGTQTLKPDEEFLCSFSGVVGSKWPSLAVSLALSEEEIMRLKEKVGLSQKDLAFEMLKIWASRQDTTYGQLYLSVD